MSLTYPRVRIPDTVTQDGAERLLARDIVRLVFFLPYDHHLLAPGVTHALDSYLREIAGHPNALVYGKCCWWEYSRLDEGEWQLIRETLEPKAPRYFDDYEPHEAFYPGKDGADPYFVLRGEPGSGYAFSYHARLPWREPPPHSVSVLSATLPTESLEERGAEHLRELARDMASRLPFASGHAGLALDLWRSIDEQFDPCRPVLLRHPGFDVREANHFDGMGTRVDGIHWMNFLGPPVLSQLGGAAGLRARLHSPTTTVQELEGERAVVTLGEAPEAGDLDQGQTLPAYRELARLSEPYLEPFPWGFVARQSPSVEEELRRWWRRFLD